MGQSLISSEKIQATPTFEGLSHLQKSFAVKRHNRDLLTNALNIVSNGGEVPSTIQGYNVGLLNDLIQADNQQKANQ